MKLRNFKTYELVSKEVYELLGEEAIKLMDARFLQNIDQLCTDLKRDLGVTTVIVNDWKWGGKYNQSGYRELISDVGSAGSMHRVGSALDLKFKGCTAKEALEYLVENNRNYLGIKRAEDVMVTKTWLHLDSKETGRSTLYIFKP